MYIVNLSVNFVLLIIIDRFFIALFSTLEQTLRSHVILHECIAFYSTFLNIHRSGVLTALAWLVPHETEISNDDNNFNVSGAVRGNHKDGVHESQFLKRKGKQSGESNRCRPLTSLTGTPCRDWIL